MSASGIGKETAGTATGHRRSSSWLSRGPLHLSVSVSREPAAAVAALAVRPSILNSRVSRVAFLSTFALHVDQCDHNTRRRSSDHAEVEQYRMKRRYLPAFTFLNVIGMYSIGELQENISTETDLKMERERECVCT